MNEISKILQKCYELGNIENTKIADYGGKVKHDGNYQMQ